MVEDGEPKRRGAEQEDEDDGWGEVETELELILIDVIVVAPPGPCAVASLPVEEFGGVVVTDTKVDA